MHASRPLFEADVPPGFSYRDDFITADEERALAAAIAATEFAAFEMRGVVAKRRVAYFGRTYDDNTRAAATPPIPEFLLTLRARAAEFARVGADAFAMALIIAYRPGAPIGWHRDAPPYGIVCGVSLLSACRMKFRPYEPPAAHARVNGPRRTTHELTLEPRSAYLMTGVSRDAFEHHIPAAAALRYSITFRTVRA
jgi:alkylated DNA repair dioxygenase AlkB